MTVVDASLLVDALRAVRSPAAQALANAEVPVLAPELLDLEVTSALRRLSGEGGLTSDDAEILLRRLELMPIKRRSHLPLLRRVWELRHAVTPYDAVYIALAEQHQAKLLTRDRAMADTPETRCEVELVS